MGQFVAIGFQVGEVVDDGVEQGVLVFGQGLGECAGGGLGGLGGREGVHFGFLAQFLEVQLGQQSVDGIAVAIHSPLEPLPHGEADIGGQLLPSGLQVGFGAGHFLKQRLYATFVSSHFFRVIGVHFGNGLVYAFQQGVSVGQLGEDGFGDFHKYGSFLFVNPGDLELNLADLYYRMRTVEITRNKEPFAEKIAYLCGRR